MEKRRILKRRKGLVISLCCLLAVLMLSCLMGSAPTAARAATTDNVEVSTNENTGYYLEMDMIGHDTWIEDNHVITASYWGEFGGTKRYTLPATLIIVFENARHEDKRVMIFANTSIEFPARFPGFDHKLTIKDTIKVNIGEGFYNLMSQSDLTSFTMTWHYKAVGYLLYATKPGDNSHMHSCSNVKLTTNLLPPDSNDPNSPNFDPVHPGGTDESTDEDDRDNQSKSIFEKLFNFLTGIFGWSITYADFKKYSIIAVAVIGGLIVLSFLIKLFKS